MISVKLDFVHDKKDYSKGMMLKKSDLEISPEQLAELVVQGCIEVLPEPEQPKEPSPKKKGA